MFLKVDNNKVSGKGYICNAEGKNGYIDDFSFTINEVGEITEEEYNEAKALAFTARLSGLYGSKRIKVYLPQLKNADLAFSLMRRLKKGDSPEVEEEKPAAETPAAPVKPEAPKSVIQPVEKPAAPVENKIQEAPKPENKITPRPVAETAPEERKPVYSVEKPVTPVEETPAVEAPRPAAKAVEEPAEHTQLSEEEFQKRMDKLTVLKDCGLLGDKEFLSKKLELVSEFCNLNDFNEKIQKLIALKDCGLLSDKEFEANRIDVIKECCDLDVQDIKEYRRNVQKLAFLEMGEVITTEEYDRYKADLVDDVRFNINDDRDTFVRKLRRMPVLKDSHVIEDRDYIIMVADMVAALDITGRDSDSTMVTKMTKWPLLEQEKFMSAGELRDKRSELVRKYLDASWSTPEELEQIIGKMMVLKEGECITAEEYNKRREDILKSVDGISDYVSRISVYKMLPTTGIITTADYEGLKQKCIDEIFVYSNSVTEFKTRANNLVELNKVGILNEEEFATYKTKLMSEL